MVTSDGYLYEQYTTSKPKKKRWELRAEKNRLKKHREDQQQKKEIIKPKLNTKQNTILNVSLQITYFYSTFITLNYKKSMKYKI